MPDDQSGHVKSRNVVSDLVEAMSAEVGDAWTCEKHNTTQESFCQMCVNDFNSRRPASEMTAEERADALEGLGKQLTISFTDLHQWIEELVGRGVMTHELGTIGFTALIEEVRRQVPATLADVLAKLPRDKPVLLVEL